ncbi:MAG TPA: aspartate/glutamate racemase family protein [Syntrophorhabdaceae bacterium]|jgi:Asp/Glu/hydantoin racemase
MAKGQGKAIRIWYQSYVDPVEQAGYIDHLGGYLASIADPGVTYDVYGISPPDRELHRLTEFRCSVQAVRNVLEAERQGYDAFIQGHYQDPGLYELRSAVKIPVLSLGESSMLFGCTLGRKIGLITIDPYFIPMHEEQVSRYGLRERVVAIKAIKTSVADFNAAFSDPQKRKDIERQFLEEARPLIEQGVEVIIPAGGLPTLLFAQERSFTLDKATVLNGIAVVVKMTEMAVKLLRLTGTGASRASTFALPSTKAIEEFLKS